jgi:hypothetical protein
MSIYNDNGVLVARAFAGAAPEPSSAVKQFDLDPTELLELVRDTIYKYEQTSTNLLEELRQLDGRQKERAAR